MNCSLSHMCLYFRFLQTGEGEFGEKSIVGLAEEIVQVAQENPTFFKTPTVVFKFVSGITPDVEEELQEVGVQVCEFDRPVECPEHQSHCINLDITTMITLVSDLSNGFSDVKFTEEFLQEQALDEQQRPVKEGQASTIFVASVFVFNSHIASS